MKKSQKFKVMQLIQNDSPLFPFIPKFYSLGINRSYSYSQFSTEKINFILRSSLKDENTEKALNSGKSVSIKNIDSNERLIYALEKVKDQENLDEIVLQEQFDYEFHLTIYFNKDLCFIQFKKNHSEKSSFSIISKSFITGNFPYLKTITKFYNIWIENKLMEEALIEAGVDHHGLKIFQIVETPKGLLKNIFTDDLIIKMIKTRENFSSRKSFFRLIKTELDAKAFRNIFPKDLNGDISTAFLNWEYLFHYFYLFCAFNRKKGYDQDFVDFLNMASNKKSQWPYDIIYHHLKLANIIRSFKSNEEMPSMFKSIGKTPYFIGRDLILEGHLNDIAIKIDILTPEYIYNCSKEKVILTPDNNILGHSYLAAAEIGIHIIGNVDRNLWNDLINEDKLFIHFKNKEFIIK